MLSGHTHLRTDGRTKHIVEVASHPTKQPIDLDVAIWSNWLEHLKSSQGDTSRLVPYTFTIS